MNDSNITEEYFLELGWERIVWNHESGHKTYTWFDENKSEQGKLPNILDHYPSFKEHVLEMMAAEGLYPHISLKDNLISGRMEGETYGARFIVWRWSDEIRSSMQTDERIKDGNILHAATMAATGYWKEKKV